jgi:hypothetical protein
MKGSRLALSFFVAAIAAAAIAVGCDASGPVTYSGYGPADNPVTVHDVTGMVFGWQCTNQCEVTQIAGTAPPDPCGAADRPGYGYTWGRFVDVCSVCLATDGTWGTSQGQCRMLACATSADCPVIYWRAPASVYECVDGLCQGADQTARPRTSLTRYEVEDLCFAPHPRAETRDWSGAGAMQVQAEVDAACPGDDPLEICSLPADCRTP